MNKSYRKYLFISFKELFIQRNEAELQNDTAFKCHFIGDKIIIK